MNFKPEQIAILQSINAYTDADIDSYSLLEGYGFNAEDIVKIAQKSCLSSLKSLLVLIHDKNGEVVFDGQYLVTTKLGELFSAGITKSMIVSRLTRAELTQLSNLFNPLYNGFQTYLFDERGLAVTPLTYLKAADFVGERLLDALNHINLLQRSFLPIKDMRGRYIIENNQPIISLIALTKAGFTSTMLLSILNSKSESNFSKLLDLLTPAPDAANPHNAPLSNLTRMLNIGFTVDMITTTLSRPGGWLNINTLLILLRPSAGSDEVAYDNQLTTLINAGFDKSIINTIIGSQGGATNLNAIASLVAKKEVADFIQKYPGASTNIADLAYKRGGDRTIKMLDSILSNEEFRAYISEHNVLAYLCHTIQSSTKIPKDLDALKKLCFTWEKEEYPSTLLMKRKQKESPQEELIPVSNVGKNASSSANRQGLFPLKKINPVTLSGKEFVFQPK